jgi:hypothetical protein
VITLYPDVHPARRSTLPPQRLEDEEVAAARG